MATFDGASFKQRAYSLPLETAAEVSVRHIPGGSNSYVDIGGVTAGRLSISARLDGEAERTALQGKVGKQGTLVYLDGTVTAVLISMRRSQRYPGDEQLADLEFVIVG